MTIPAANLLWLTNLLVLCLMVWFNIGTFMIIKQYMKNQYHRYDKLSDSLYSRFEKIEQMMQQCGQSIQQIQLEIKSLNIVEQD